MNKNVFFGVYFNIMSIQAFFENLRFLKFGKHEKQFGRGSVERGNL
jgi:hypothetical protein